MPTDSRRQTGAGRLLDAPGAALEVRVDAADRDTALDAWQQHARALAGALGWPAPQLGVRDFDDAPGGRVGLSLGITAPVDRLYTAATLNETAWALASADLRFATDADADADEAAHVARLRALDADEARPALTALVAAAERHGLPCLWDADAVTLGLGTGGQTFPAEALPTPDTVDWHALHGVPTALITGTNGKSTTVRLTAALARAAGHTPGVSTTDYVAVGDEIVETGDFSGPMGARAALRDQRATLGVLEIARGGLLRRGVPFAGVDAAAVTNVAADHLGDYGVLTVEQLAETKFVVAKALRPGGALVLNADDALVTAEADRQAEALATRGAVLVWTTLDPAHPRLASGGPAASVVDGHVVLRASGGAWRPIVAADAIPCTLGGTARHNVRNALTACAVGAALGLADRALADGLLAFAEKDNPGRINRFQMPTGGRVVIDYAHNAHGIAAVCETVAAWPSRSRTLLMSVGGDRSDADFAAMADAARAFGADRYLLADLPEHLRGRPPGDAPATFIRALVAGGVAPEACTAFVDPLAAVRAAVAADAPGALALLFVLSQRPAVFDVLREAGGVAEG